MNINTWDKYLKLKWSHSYGDGWGSMRGWTWDEVLGFIEVMMEGKELLMVRRFNVV